MGHPRYIIIPAWRSGPGVGHSGLMSAWPASKEYRSPSRSGMDHEADNGTIPSRHENHPLCTEPRRCRAKPSALGVIDYGQGLRGYLDQVIPDRERARLPFSRRICPSRTAPQPGKRVSGPGGECAGDGYLRGWRGGTNLAPNWTRNFIDMLVSRLSSVAIAREAGSGWNSGLKSPLACMTIDLRAGL